MINCTPNNSRILSQEDIKNIQKSHEGFFVEGLSFNQQRAVVKSIANELYRNSIKGESTKYSDLKQEIVTNLNSDIEKANKYIELNNRLNLSVNNSVLQERINRLNSIKQNIDLLFTHAEELLKRLDGISVHSVTDDEIRENQEDEEIDNEAGTEALLERTSFTDDFYLSLDTKNTTSGRLKKFLSFVEEREYSNRVNVPVKSILGKTSFLDFDYVYNELHRILSGTKTTRKDILDTLTSAAAEADETFNKNLAWLSPFVQYLKTIDNPDSGLNSAEKEELEAIQREFVSDMAKHKINMWYINYNTTKSEEGTIYYQNKLYNDDSGSIVQRTLQNWKKKHDTSDIVQDGVYSSTIKEELLSKLATVSEAKTDIDKATIISNILSSLGINLADKYIDSIFVNGKFVYYGNRNKASRNDLYSKDGILARTIEEIIPGTSPENGKLMDSSFVRGLAAGNSRYTKDEFSNSFRVGDKTIYTYTMNHYLSNISRALTEKKSKRREDLSKAEFSKDSLYLAMLNNEDTGFKNDFSIDYLSLQPLKKSKAKKRSDATTELSPMDYEVVKYSAYINGGIDKGSFDDKVINGDKLYYKKAFYFFPTNSDKSRVMLMKGIAFDAVTRDGEFTNAALNLFYDSVVKPEINRIFSTSDPDFKNKANLASYDGSKFYLLPELNNLLLPVEDIATDNIIQMSLAEIAQANPELSEEHKQIVLANLSSILNKYTEKKVAKWKDLNLLTDKNHLVHLENTKDHNNTWYNSKQAAGNMVFNYMIANANAFQLIIGDPSQYSKKNIKKTYDNITKRLAAEIAPGVESEGKDFLQLFIDDIKAVSDSINYLETLLGKEEASKYREINVADAQEYSTWKFYIEELLNRGLITQTEYNSAYEAFSKGQNPSKEVFNKVLQPLKPLYAYNEVQPVGNIYIDRKTYIKSSIFPLIPSLTKGLQIDVLREAMEKLENSKANNPEGLKVKAAYASAVKVGFPANSLKLNSDENENLTSNVDLTGKYIRLKREGFRIQQDIPYDSLKAFINDGTQQKKLLFTNIIDEKLKAEYIDTYEKLYALGLQEFNSRIYDNGVVNQQKLSDILKAELIKNGKTSKPLLDGLDIVNGKFKVPLWLSPFSDKYSSLLASIVKNMIVSHKLPGKSFVLGSNAGFKISEESVEEINKRTGIVFTDSYNPEKGLTATYYDDNAPVGSKKLKYAQVIVPFKFKDSEGNILDIKQFLTEDNKLDLNKIPKELLNLFGFRIPTQLHASMTAIEVVGFLPETSGDLIIAPAEFTVQMGSDFDVDKLYTYMYATMYDKETGKLSKIENITNKKSEFYKSSLHNKLLDIHFKVMEKPELQKSIHSPLGFGLYPEIIKRLESVSSKEIESIISDQYQEDRFFDGTSGKAGVGMFSADSVFNALAQNKDLVLLESDESGEKVPVSVKFGNKYKPSNGELSDIYTNKIGSTRFKTEVIAADQNLSVDNANEQGMHVINLNKTTFKVKSILNFLGFEEDISALFIAQPIIRDYVIRMKNSRSLLAEYNPNAEKEIVDSLINTYSEGKYNRDTDLQLADFNGKDASETMFDLIEKGKSYPDFGKYQAAILEKFMYLQKIENPLSSVKQLLNLDSKGFSKNMYINKRRQDTLYSLKDSPILNSESLFGIVDNDFGIIPVTTAGFDNIYGNDTLIRSFGEYFVESNPSMDFKSIVGSVENLSGRQLSEKQINRLKDSYKNYLMSNINSTNIDKIRRELFTNKDENSFYRRLVKFQNTAYGRDNRFLSSLEVLFTKYLEVNYNNAASDNFDESDIYKSFVDLFMDTNDRNGIVPSELAEDLVIYSLLRGGNKAQQFIKFIPVEVLEKILSIPEKNVDINIFFDQWVKHNSNEAILISNDNVVRTPDKNIIKLSISAPNYIRVLTGKNESLYKLVEGSENSYRKINTLGTDNITEYTPYNKELSIFKENNEVNATNVDKTNPLDTKEIIEVTKSKNVLENTVVTTDGLNFNSLSSLLQSIVELRLPEYREYIKLARILIPNINIDTRVVEDHNSSSHFDVTENVIHINPNTKKGKDLVETIIHETLHSLSSNYIWNMEEDKEIPSEIKKALLRLNGFKNQLILNLSPDVKEDFDEFLVTQVDRYIREGKEFKIQQLLKSKFVDSHVKDIISRAYFHLKNPLEEDSYIGRLLTIKTPFDRDSIAFYYSLINLHEFIAVAGSNPVDRDNMIKLAGNKYVEGIKDLFRKILEFLGITNEESAKFLNDIFTASNIKETTEPLTKSEELPVKSFEELKNELFGETTETKPSIVYSKTNLPTPTRIVDVSLEQKDIEQILKYSNKIIGRGTDEINKSFEEMFLTPKEYNELNRIGEEIEERCKGKTPAKKAKKGLRITHSKGHSWNIEEGDFKVHAKHGLVISNKDNFEEPKEKNIFTKGFSWQQTNLKCGGYAETGGILPRKTKKSEPLNSLMWKVVADLDGPSHKQGGINLSVEDGKVHFSNGKSKVHAKCGCLIKAKKAEEGIMIKTKKSKIKNYGNN